MKKPYYTSSSNLKDSDYGETDSSLDSNDLMDSKVTMREEVEVKEDKTSTWFNTGMDTENSNTKAEEVGEVYEWKNCNNKTEQDQKWIDWLQGCC